MHQSINTDNYIFIYAFTGALLFIASIVFVITNLANMAVFSYAAIAAILGFSSISLLYKAIKHDKVRMSSLNP